MPCSSRTLRRSFVFKSIAILILFTLSGVWALASAAFREDDAPHSLHYYTEVFVPSLTREPFARALADVPDEDVYQYAFGGYNQDDDLYTRSNRGYLDFIAQDPVYPLHISLLGQHLQQGTWEDAHGETMRVHLGIPSGSSKLYRFSSGCNLPVYLGNSNILFSEPLGSIFTGSAFDDIPLLAAPEPAAWLVYLTLTVLTIAVLRRRVA